MKEERLGRWDERSGIIKSRAIWKQEKRIQKQVWVQEECPDEGDG